MQNRGLPTADRPVSCRGVLPTALRTAGLCLGFVIAGVHQAAGQPLTDGYQNVFRSEAPGTLLSHPDDNDSAAIGRTTTLNYLNGWLVVGGEVPGAASGSDLEMRVYDIADPTNPVRLRPGDFGRSYSSWHTGNTGYNAHAQAMVGNSLWPEGIYVNSWSGPVENTSDGNPRPWHDLLASGFNRSSLMSPWYASMTWYGGSSGEFTISRKFRDSDGDVFRRDLAQFDHQGQFGGGEWHPIFFGDLLIYARSQDGTGENGVVIYRLRYENFEDPQAASITPELVAASEQGLFAYWPNLYGYHRDRLYIVGSQRNHIEVMDITAAADPAVPGSGILEVREDNSFPNWPNALSNATYPAYQDNHAFIQRYKLDMDLFIAGAPANEYRVLELQENDEGVSTSQMSLPLGNLWLTGGLGSLAGDGRRQGMAIWVQDNEPDTRRPRVGYHIPQANRTHYPRWAPLSFFVSETPRGGAPQVGDEFTVRKINSDGSRAASVTGLTIRSFSSEITFTPDSPLDADSTYEVEWLSDASLGRGFRDAAGNYIEPYTFRFSTGADVTDPGTSLLPPSLIEFSASHYQQVPGALTNLTVQADGIELEYRFRIGTDWSPWSATPELEVTLNDPGRYNVSVEVRNDSGTVAGSLTLVVQERAAGPLPTRSTTLAMSVLDGERVLWSLSPDNDSASVVSASDGVHRAEHVLCDDPRNIASDRDGRLWVSCQGADEITVFDPDGELFQRLSTGYGSAPHGLVASPDGDSIYVSLYSAGRLLRVSVDDFTMESIDTFPTPRAIAVSGDGQRVFVTRFISSEDYGEVVEIASTASGLSIVRHIELAYADEEDGPQRASGVPNYVAGIAISPDGTRAVVTSKQDNTRRGLMYGRDRFTHDTRVRPIYSVLDLEQNREIIEARKDFDNREGVYDVAFSPDGSLLLFTLQGSNSLVVTDAIDLDSAAPHNVTPLIDQLTGLAPQGLLVDAQDQRIFTQNFTARSTTVFDAENLFATNTTSLSMIAEVASTAQETLTSEQLLGLQVFYNAADPRMSAESYISCATCHIDGGHDGRVWDTTERGEGLRRTIDLRGRSGMGHGNVHWSANFDEIQDFEHDIRDAFGGEGFLDLTPTEFAAQHPDPSSLKRAESVELDALAAYVSSLDDRSIPRSPWRNNDGTLTAAAQRGEALFADMNCSGCHARPRFTNSAVADVTTANLENPGTTATFSGSRLGGAPLAGVDVPTLLGLHATTRFLHHGQATTLRDALAFLGGSFVDGGGGVAGVETGVATGGGGAARGMFGNDYVQVGTGAAGWMADVDGPWGASTRIGIRYASDRDEAVTLSINGVNQSVPLTATQAPGGNGPVRWRWHWVVVELPGGSSQIAIENAAGATLWLDGVLIPDASTGNAARVHTQALDLDEQGFDDLLAYLYSLDASDSQPGSDSVDATITLFDARSGEWLGTLVDGASFPNDWAERSLTLRVTPSAPIGSAEIVVNQRAPQTENIAPYFAFGDNSGNIIGRGRVLGEGQHRFSTTLYSKANRAGTVLGSLSLDFTVAPPPLIPETPVVVRIDVGDGEIVIWLSSGNADDAGIQYQASCSDGFADVVAMSSSSRIIVTGLVNGRAYRCRVNALSDQGLSSSPSAETAVITPEVVSTSTDLPLWLLLYQVQRASQAPPVQ